MRILITGICGFVGRQLAEGLRDHHEPGSLEIVGIDNLSRPGSWINREPLLDRDIAVHHGDIRAASDLEAIGPVNWIIDSAANPSVMAGLDGKSSSRQLVENNLGGTINLLEHCRKYGAGFTLMSTSRVYSIGPLSQLEVEVSDRAFRPRQGHPLPEGISTEGITESFSTAPPVSLYGSTKVSSEHLALEYGAAFDFPVWINRCGVLAGAGQFGKPDQGIFAYWLHSWRAKQPMRYIGFDGQGHQVRDVLHPRDLVPLLVKQLENLAAKVPRTVNVSGGLNSARSLRQLSDWCLERWGDHGVVVDSNPRPFDLPWIVLDSSLARETWDWNPQTSVESILEEIAGQADADPDWLELSRNE